MPHNIDSVVCFPLATLVGRRQRGGTAALGGHVVGVAVHVAGHLAEHGALTLLLLVLDFEALATDLEAVHALNGSLCRRSVVVAHETCASTKRQNTHSQLTSHCSASAICHVPNPRLLPVSFSTMMRALITLPNVAK